MNKTVSSSANRFFTTHGDTTHTVTSHTITTHALFVATIVVFSLCCFLSCGGGGGSSTDVGQLFEITIDNIAPNSALTSANGQPAPVAFAPAVFAVHSGSGPFYTIGQVAPQNGIDAYAEAGDTSKLVQSLQSAPGVKLIGLAQTPVGETGAAALVPGSSYKADIAAHGGDKLSLVLAFLQGNDLVVGPGSQGIALFDADGNAISGDITAQFSLLDVGTELNERPGDGPNQDPRQATVTSGTPESVPVGPVSDGFTYPALGSVLRITIAPK